MNLKRALAAQFGVHLNTVESYRQCLIKGYRKELSGQELEDRRAEFLVRLRGHQRSALSAGRHGPLAAMMNLESKITGVDRIDAEDGPTSVEVILRVPQIDDGG